MKDIVLSKLPHTWLIDLDGTILRHNGHLVDDEILLPGVLDFWRNIPNSDLIILLSARLVTEEQATLDFIKEKNLRFDGAIFGLTKGERILINDMKPTNNLATAIALNVERDIGLRGFRVIIDETI